MSETRINCQIDIMAEPELKNAMFAWPHNFAPHIKK